MPIPLPRNSNTIHCLQIQTRQFLVWTHQRTKRLQSEDDKMCQLIATKLLMWFNRESYTLCSAVAASLTAITTGAEVKFELRNK